MMTTLKLAELTPTGQAEVRDFVTARYPGYHVPDLSTNIRITEQRVEFSLTREHPPFVTSRLAHMQITDAIASSVLDALVGEKVGS